MPHVQRSVQIPVDTDAATLANVLAGELHLEPVEHDAGTDERPRGRHSWSGAVEGMPDTESRLVVHFTPDETDHVALVELVAVSTVIVPFFTWFLRVQGF